MAYFNCLEMAAIASFMQTVVKHVPKLKEKAIRSKSFLQLTQPHEDEDGIVLSRENSRDNINAYNNNAMRRQSAIVSSNSDLISAPRLGSGISVLRENSVESFMRLNKLSLGSQSKMDLSSSGSNNNGSTKTSLVAIVDDEGNSLFDLPSGIITMATATQIIALFKAGGKLSNKAVHKILRLAYRKIKKLQNISRVIIGPTDKLTVVGDIHGNCQILS
jgi:hypothetical protein